MFSEKEKTEWFDAHDFATRPTVDGEYEFQMRGTGVPLLRPFEAGVWRSLVHKGETFYTLPGDRWRGLKCEH